MEKDFLDAKQLQQWLGISKPTLLCWLRRGDDPFPGVKIGGRWRFRRKAVLEWWARQEQGRMASKEGGPPRQMDKTVSKGSSMAGELASWLSIASKLLEEESEKEAA